MMSEGTKNIIEAMKARGIRKVIGCMSGTTSCYKKPFRGPHEIVFSPPLEVIFCLQIETVFKYNKN